jgi:capsular exopolysaccharide synthesis family protein
MGGLGLAFIFENLDRTLYTKQQIEEVTQLPTLGKIPLAKGRQKVAIFSDSSVQEEAFRRLRTNLLSLEGGPPKTLLVTSAEPDEGKSTIVANLARAFALSRRRVIVVDGDMRLPTLHKIFDLPNNVGLSNVLRHEARLSEAVQHSSVGDVYVLTSGPIPSNPAELLGASAMSALIKQLAEHFDIVLIDGPAILAVTDAAVLAQDVEAVLLVVGRARAEQEKVRAARQQLANVKANLVGAVVNRSERTEIYSYYLGAPAQHAMSGKPGGS